MIYISLFLLISRLSYHRENDSDFIRPKRSAQKYGGLIYLHQPNGASIILKMNLKRVDSTFYKNHLRRLPQKLFH